MTKEDMVQVLRSVGVNENTITAMENAFEIGAAYEREQCVAVCSVEAVAKDESDHWTGCAQYLANNIAERGAK